MCEKCPKLGHFLVCRFRQKPPWTGSIPGGASIKKTRKVCFLGFLLIHISLKIRNPVTNIDQFKTTVISCITSPVSHRFRGVLYLAAFWQFGGAWPFFFRYKQTTAQATAGWPLKPLRFWYCIQKSTLPDGVDMV
jgi:hypothetical protein